MEEEKSVDTNLAPETAPLQESAPAPQEDAVVNAEDERETVNVADLISTKKAADKDGSGAPKDDKAADPKSPAPVKDDKPGDAPPTQQAQKDIDVAIGRRLAAAEKKWTEKNAPLLQLAQLVRDANPDLTEEQLVAKFEEDRNAALGLSPQLAGILKKKGLLGADPILNDEPASFTEEEQQAAADRIGLQADEILKLVPDFNLKDFMGQISDQLDGLMRGEVSLPGLYYEKNIETLLKGARDAGFAEGQKTAVTNIRNRNNQVPNPPTPSAPGDTTVDFSKMTTKQWKEANAAIEQAVRDGKRVTL